MAFYELLLMSLSQLTVSPNDKNINFLWYLYLLCSYETIMILKRYKTVKNKKGKIVLVCVWMIRHFTSTVINTTWLHQSAKTVHSYTHIYTKQGILKIYYGNWYKFSNQTNYIYNNKTHYTFFIRKPSFCLSLNFLNFSQNWAWKVHKLILTLLK